MPLKAQIVYIQGNDGLMAEDASSPFPGALIVLDGNLKYHFYIKTNVGILQSEIPNSRLGRLFLCEVG